MSDEQTTNVDSSQTDDSDIIARLTAVLESNQDQTETPEEEQGVEEAETEVEAESTDEVISEEQEGDEVSEEPEEVQEDSTEDSEEEVEAEPEVITEGFVEIDGEKLSIEDVKLGYLRQSDYTKKTQAVAEQRKAADEQSRVYESTLSALLSTAGADLRRFDNVDWEKAAVENPEQYKQAKAMYEQTRATYETIKRTSDENTKRQQAQQQAESQEKAQESLTVLKSTIPNWNNDLYYSIGEYAKDSLGVSVDEFNEVNDHRLITALYKAMQFDRAKKETQKKVKATPQKTLSGKKAEPKDLGREDNYRKAKARLKSSGSTEDAVQALLNRKTRL
jgi:hypothetical protein